MNKYFYPIFKLPTFYERDYVKEELPLWVKWWLLGKAGRELSEILTGSEFTLLHTLNKKFKLLQIKGNTEQEQLTGKNLFDISKVISSTNDNVINNDDGTLKVRGYGASAGSPNKLKTYCPTLQVGDEVIISADTTSSNKFIYLSGTNTSWAFGTTRTITQSDLYSIVLWYGASDGDTNYYTISNIMVRKSSVTDSSYEPYCGGIPSPNPEFPQQIKNVTGNANIKIQNKNLVNNDFTKWTNDTYAYIPIQLKQGQAYTLSAKRVGELKTKYYNFGIVKDGTSYPFVGFNSIIDYTSGNPLSDYTFTPDDTWTNPKLVCYIASSETRFNELFQNYNIQLEQGTTATSYVPHQEQNYPFTFAQSQRGMQGTTLQDDGIHNKWCEVSLTNQFWGKYPNTDNLGNTFGFFMNLKKIPKRDITATNFAKCNILMQKQRTKVSTSDEEGFYLGDGTDALFIKIRQSLIPNGTIEELQTLLTNTNAKIQFELAEAEEEIIPYNETQATQYNAIKEAHTYKDETYISGESDELPPLLDIQYWEERGT